MKKKNYTEENYIIVTKSMNNKTRKKESIIRKTDTYIVGRLIVRPR